MIELVFKACLTTLVTALLLALLLFFLVCIVYFLASTIRIAYHAYFKDEDDDSQ